MMKLVPRASMIVGLAMVATGCAPPPERPDDDIHIRYAVSGRVRLADVMLRHPADSRHGCLAGATSQAPHPGQPPSHVLGYSVVFGPDFHPEIAHLNPEWIAYGPQTRFSLEVFARPGTDGPAGLGRAFRIAVAAGDRLWERSAEEDNPATDAVVTIAPDGLSGRFRVTGLVQQIPHNRMPDSEAIAVAGTWRCPAP